MVILGCYFTEDGTGLFSSVCRACSTLLVPYSTNPILKCGVLRAVLVVDDKDSHHGTGDDFRKCDVRTLLSLIGVIDHFRVHLSLHFKARLSAKCFVMEISFHSY